MLKRLFKFRTNRDQLSVESALKRLFTNYEFQALLAHTPDRRSLVEYASERLGVSEESLVTTLGEMLDIPVTFNILPVSFQELLSSPSIETFSIAGAFPIVTNGAVVGIVTSDPARALVALGIKDKITIHLSTSRRIQAALQECRVSLDLQREKIKEEEKARLEKTAEAILGIVIEEAESFGAASATIVFGDQDIEYFLSTEESQKAKGSIDRRIKEPLETVLRRGLNSKEVSFRMSDDKYRHGVRTSVSSDSVLTFILTWTKKGEKETLESKPSNLIPFPGIEDSRTPKQVLLIDDNETFAKVLDRFLDRYKIKCHWMADASAAYSSLESGSIEPGAIICDVHMPEMNGFEFLSKLRANEKLRSIPIVMLTSDQDIETELNLLSRGADVFIGKTQDPRLLCVHVKRLLDKSGAKEAA